MFRLAPAIGLMLRPYLSYNDIPAPMRSHLPSHAQDLYRDPFNHDFAARRGDPRQDELAHCIA
jgi:cation transport regulator